MVVKQTPLSFSSFVWYSQDKQEVKEKVGTFGLTNPTELGPHGPVQEDKHPSCLHSKPSAQRQQGMNSSSKTSSLPSYDPVATGKVLEAEFLGFRSSHGLGQFI